MPAPLMARKLEVLRRVAAGLKNREIAHELLDGVVTVEFCVRRLITKLGVGESEQATARAVDIGPVPPPGSPNKSSRRLPAKNLGRPRTLADKR